MLIAPNDTSYKTFTELLTAYRISDIIILIGDTGLMDVVGDEGNSVDTVVEKLGWHIKSGRRFIECLCGLGLLGRYEETVYRTPFSNKFLASDSDNFQGATLEFEKMLIEKWSHLGDCLKTGKGAPFQDKAPEEYKKTLEIFIAAMDDAALIRSKELWNSFNPRSESGTILELGSGSGAYITTFLEINPKWNAIFCDLHDVVELAKKSDELKPYIDRIQFIECNLLDSDPALPKEFHGKADIILASNFLHCQGFDETAGIMKKVIPILSEKGMFIDHDFFTGQNWQGALYDMHMMVNTYNGRTYSTADIAGLCKGFGLASTYVKNMPSASTALFAARSPNYLPETGIIPTLDRRAKELGFMRTIAIDPSEIPVKAWVQEKCKYGCPTYGKKNSCPPYSHTYEQMKDILSDFTQAILIIGEPPLHIYQEKLIELERFAFTEGFYKALAFGAGPCSICKECDVNHCHFPEKRRPSLEASGVDVFALMNNYGIAMTPLKSKTDFVQYVSLLLVE